MSTDGDVVAPAGIWEDTDDDVEGLLDEWQVAAGDTVTVGQALASLMVVKTSYELDSPLAGTVAEVCVAEGETFGRETVLARIFSP